MDDRSSRQSVLTVILFQAVFSLGKKAGGRLGRRDKGVPLLIVAAGVVSVENRPHRMFEWSNSMAKAAVNVQLALLIAVTVAFLLPAMPPA